MRATNPVRAGKRSANGQGEISSSPPAVSSPLAAWLSKPRRHLINGRWVGSASGKTFDVFNPADESLIARAAEGDAEDIDRAVSAARRAFESGPWPRMTPSERGKLLWRIGDLILQHGDELAELESIDNGKPRAVARVADIPLAADLFHYMAGWATKIEGHTIALILFPTRAFMPIPCANLSASLGKSFRGISRCSWPPGSSALRWLPGIAPC